MTKKRVPNLSNIVFEEVKTPETLQNKLQDNLQNLVEEERDFAKQDKHEDKISYEVREPLVRVEKKIEANNLNSKVKSTTIYLPNLVKEQLEKLWFAERHNKSQNDLILEGLDFLFKDRGLPSIKELLDK